LGGLRDGGGDCVDEPTAPGWGIGGHFDRYLNDELLDSMVWVKLRGLLLQQQCNLQYEHLQRGRAIFVILRNRYVL
jgi:hypothetical protein